MNQLGNAQIIRNIIIRGLIPISFFVSLSGFTLQERNPENGYYVTIAAYAVSKEVYASRFTQKVNALGHSAKYVFFDNKNMFFVYLNYFSDREPSITEMQKIRENAEFDDAWVYIYKDRKTATSVINTPPSQVEEPSKQENKAKIMDTPVANSPYEETVEVAEPEVEGAKLAKDLTELEKDPFEGMYKLYLSVAHEQTGRIIDGNIQLIDPKFGNIVKLLKSNATEYINPPNNSNTNAQFEAAFFGFRKMIHTIDLKHPANDTTEYFVDISGDSITVAFNLIKYVSGDIFTMFNVYFFSHSAIMRPESMNELNQLLDMLNKNPVYKIMIHGHTNGNGVVDDARYRPKGDAVMFSLTGAIEKSSTAKQLSVARAEAVKNFLIREGINESRMKLKGWGGKRMLFKKLDNQSIQNVRVEVEILGN